MTTMLSDKEIHALFHVPEAEKARAQRDLLAQGEHAVRVAWTLAQREDGDAVSALAFLCAAANKPRLLPALNAALDSREPLYALLGHPNPKCRKNAARLLGALSDKRDEDALLAALALEAVRYVRPSIILALGNCGAQAAADALREMHIPDGPPEDEKHARAERDAISAALGKLSPNKRHTFRALDEASAFELRALEGYSNLLAAEAQALGYASTVLTPNSVRLTLSDTAPLARLRTYTEALLELAKDVPFTPHAIAKAVHSQGLIRRLSAMHDAGAPFAYRVELRGVPHEARLPFIRELASLLPGDLINAPSNYDIELRVEAKLGRCALYTKLYTLPDTRFGYRVQTVPAAMHPVTAATILRAFGARLKPGARVLDPCCGGGTLLIERAKLTPCVALHGVDIAQSAVDIARACVREAGAEAWIVRQDILRFTAQKPYDEVIANLPFGLRVGEHGQNERLYALLTARLPALLAKGGVALLVTAEKSLMRKVLRAQSSMKLLEETQIEAGGLTPSVFLLMHNA